MGSSSTKQTQQINLSINHPKFQNTKFITNNEDKLMQIMISIDKKDYDKWKNLYNSSISNRQFMLLPVKEQFQTKGICGYSGTLILDFELFPFLLTEQISDRKGKKKLFQQHQLWYLLFALLSVKKSISPPFSKIGDVRPHNIFINDKGQIKIITLLSWPNQSTNFNKTIQNQLTYLSPQEIKQLSQGISENDRNYQSELFSIGLTLLSAIAFQDFLDVYDINKQTINTNKINQKLLAFQTNLAYSDIFKGVICNLCQFDQSKRIPSQQLWNWISPHQQQIRSRQNFYISSAPPKIKNQVNQVRAYLSQFFSNPTTRSTHLQPKSTFIPANTPTMRSNPSNPKTGFNNNSNFAQAQSVYISAKPINTPVDINSQLLQYNQQYTNGISSTQNPTNIIKLPYQTNQSNTLPINNDFKRNPSVKKNIV